MIAANVSVCAVAGSRERRFVASMIRCLVRADTRAVSTSSSGVTDEPSASPADPSPSGWLMTPGGYHSFDHRWALPEDIEPLRQAARAVAAGRIDVALFTTATQVVHLLQVARDLDLDAAVRRGLASVAVASIGPTTSDELREQEIAIDIEASHPKMGFLVREAAERAADVLRTKRGGAALG